MSPKGVSLRSQLLLWLLLPLGLLWAVESVVVYSLSKKFTDVAYDRSLFESTRALASRVHGNQGKVTIDLPREAVDILRYDETDMVYFAVRSADGEMLAGDEDLAVPESGAATPQYPIFHDGMVHGRRVRIASLFLPVKHAPPGTTILVQVAETLGKRAMLAQEILTGVVVPQLVLILLAAVSVWYGVGRGLAPLKKLEQAIANRSHRDLSPVTAVAVPREVSSVLQSVNDLMARLDTALSAQQRFVADAAHQLRTPLAGIKTQTELALRENDLEGMRQSLRQLAGSADRATRLANQLLALARAEPGARGTGSHVPVDLAQVARKVASEWVPEALKKKIDLGFEGPDEPTFVSGDAFLLQEMLVNLVDNAVRYTPEGGNVTVRIISSDDKVELCVEDNGPGIPENERERVFERFYRVLGTAANGSGLGLAIVREIVSAHGAQIIIGAPAERRGTSINVIFPPLPQIEGIR
jgi:two-component system sensor histidine kinase TctE